MSPPHVFQVKYPKVTSTEWYNSGDGARPFNMARCRSRFFADQWDNVEKDEISAKNLRNTKWRNR